MPREWMTLDGVAVGEDGARSWATLAATVVTETSSGSPGPGTDSRDWMIGSGVTVSETGSRSWTTLTGEVLSENFPP